MIQPRSVKSEQRTRENLAPLYRILGRSGMSDLANQEVGARIGEQPVDDDSPRLNDGRQNLARWIFGQRPEVNYFVHGHCENVTAVSATRDGLIPRSAVTPGHFSTKNLLHHKPGIFKLERPGLIFNVIERTQSRA